MRAQHLQFESLLLSNIPNGSYGVAVADYDGDGWEDLFFAASGGGSALFRNNGDGSFDDVTVAAGIDVPGDAVQPLWADIDNDGDADLFVGVRSYAGGASRLFRNDGAGRFSDISGESGIDMQAIVGSATFGDYDGDGWVDLFLATRDSYDRLYRNAGGRFDDVTAASNVAGLDFSIAMQAAWRDFDRDGDLDLFAVHDGNHTSRFYKNVGSFPPFVDVTENASLAVARSSMGVAWGDYDNDGWPDVYVTNIDAGNLFRNRGDGTFEDVTVPSGTQLNGMSWGAVFADFDNDGDEDLFIGNTYGFDGRPSMLYENRGGVFVDVAQQAFVALRHNIFGVATGDFDRDGRVDIVIADGSAHVLMNRSGQSGNWLSLDLEGDASNAMGVGVGVRVVAEGRSMYRTVDGGSSFCAQSSSRLHVGLGMAGVVDTLEIDWGGRIEQFTHLEANRLFVAREGRAIQVSNEALPLQAGALQFVSVFPNPVAGSATIEFDVPRSQFVRLRVNDALGRTVAEPLHRQMAAGRHTVVWDKRALPAAVYFLRLIGEEESDVRSVTVVRF